MKKIGIPLKFLDFKREVTETIDAWFREVTERFSIYQKEGAFDANQLSKNQWAITKDTDSGGVGLAINDNGTLKAIYVAPTFYAHQGNTISIASGTTYNVIPFDTELFDSENWFDTSTGRFQPQLAGHYLIIGQVNFDMSSGAPPASTVAGAILKNGTTWSETWSTVPAIANEYFATVSCILQLNGTTDYVEFGAWQNSGTNRPISTNGTRCYFTGTLVRCA